jgi:hypothetical protein
MEPVMSKSGPERQNESGRMPLAICHNGRVLHVIDPNGPYANEALDGDMRSPLAQHMSLVVAVHGLRFEDVELLAICHRHPQSFAADCLDCEPL